MTDIKEELLYEVYGVKFIDKGNAKDFIQIEDTKSEIEELKLKEAHLKSLCQHTELSTYFKQSTEKGEAFDNGYGNDIHERVNVKIHCCKVCGKLVHVYEDGSMMLGW